MTLRVSARAVTIGGVIQMLHVVIYKRIQYPLTYFAVSEEQIRQLQHLVNKLIRLKAKLSKRVPTELLFTHENMGGLEMETLEDIINLDKMFVTMQCLYTDEKL